MDTGYANNNNSSGNHYSNYSNHTDWWGMGNISCYPPPAHPNNQEPSRTTFVTQTTAITPINFPENKKQEPEKPKIASPEKKQHFGFFHRVKEKISAALNFGDCLVEDRKLKR